MPPQRRWLSRKFTCFLAMLRRRRVVQPQRLDSTPHCPPFCCRLPVTQGDRRDLLRINIITWCILSLRESFGFARYVMLNYLAKFAADCQIEFLKRGHTRGSF